MSARIEVEGLTHRFEGHEVLREITFTVDPGEILAIMGSSGGGKTTLLRCISGLLRPTVGRVTVGGVDVVIHPEKARERIGLVFQSAALFDYLNVTDNVLFGVRRRGGLRAAEQARLVAQTLQAVDLVGHELKAPSELSGGMRKRVGLARALAMRPDVLLYDEPTSGLDPVTAYSIDQLIVKTRASTGATSVVVSHDVNSVFRVADRIAFLDSGRLGFVGSVTEFREAADDSIEEILEKARAERLAAES